MTQYGFYFDATRCTGCKTCEAACRDYHQLKSGQTYRHVYELEGGNWSQDANGCWTTDGYTYYTSFSCQHCSDPACTHVCPTGAMHKDAETGLVAVDAGKCVGCGYCHMACPYNAPKVNREKGHSVKCDGCAERLAAGEQPVCVEACPARALDFGPVDEMRKKGERAAIAPLPEPSYTQPNLYVKASADAKPAGDAAAKVSNPLEVM